jgi:hypothetical protein
MFGTRTPVMTPIDATFKLVNNRDRAEGVEAETMRQYSVQGTVNTAMSFTITDSHLRDIAPLADEFALCPLRQVMSRARSERH